MYPILFQIGEISIYSYGVMIALGILVAALALYREAPREGINPDHVLEAIIVAAIAGLVGARLLYVILNFSSYKGRLLEAFFTRFEGLSFYGAFIGGVLGVLLWARWRRVEFFKIADLFAPAWPWLRVRAVAVFKRLLLRRQRCSRALPTRGLLITCSTTRSSSTQLWGSSFS